MQTTRVLYRTTNSLAHAYINTRMRVLGYVTVTWQDHVPPYPSMQHTLSFHLFWVPSLSDSAPHSSLADSGEGLSINEWHRAYVNQTVHDSDTCSRIKACYYEARGAALVRSPAAVHLPGNHDPQYRSRTMKRQDEPLVRTSRICSLASIILALSRHSRGQGSRALARAS